jgi:hydrogenase maturation protease
MYLQENRAGRNESNPIETLNINTKELARLTMERISIIGIGNTAQQDDGIGVWLVEDMMKKTWPPEFEFVGLMTRVHELPLYMIEKDVVIIIDAFDGVFELGTIFHSDYPELLTIVNKKQFFKAPNISVHDASFGYCLGAGFFAGFSPPVFFIGIQPATIDFGYGLSPQLQSSFPQLVLRVESLLRDICEGKCIERKRTSDLGIPTNTG